MQENRASWIHRVVQLYRVGLRKDKPDGGDVSNEQFLMTRVMAFTIDTAILENGLKFEGRGKTYATCSTGLIGNVNIAKADMKTVSHVKGVSLLANIVLHLNLVTSTIKRASVESVLVSFEDVETTCRTTGGMDAMCAVLSNQISSHLRTILEGPFSAVTKEAMQSVLNSQLPIGPGELLSAQAPVRQAPVRAADAPPLDEPRSLQIQLTWACALCFVVIALCCFLKLYRIIIGRGDRQKQRSDSTESDLLAVRGRSLSAESAVTIDSCYSYA